MVETYVVTAPAYWASALINGDYSGIDCGQECERIVDFEGSLCPGVITSCDEPEFLSCPALQSDTPGELAGDYCQYTVIVPK